MPAVPRVRQVVTELRGEKIDIVAYSDDPYEFVAKALQPARVKEVRIDEMTGTAMVIVPDHQLSLAIGKEGQNARLAGRLTGWAIDIKSETQLAEAEAAYAAEDWAEGEWVVDEETGEQVWQPAEGGPAVSATEYLESSDADEVPETDASVDHPEDVDTTPTSEPDAAADPGEAGSSEPEMAAEGEGVQPLDPAPDLAEAAAEAEPVEVGDDPSERLEQVPEPAEVEATDAEATDAETEPT